MAKPNKNCALCDAPFYIRPYDVRRGKGRYCSHACRNKAARAVQDVSGPNNPGWKGGVWRENTRLAAAAWNKSNPDKRRCHHQVEAALASGKLTKTPCQKCGAADRLDAHHEDYSKPLEVTWLCRRCHLLHHRTPASVEPACTSLR